MKDPEVASSLDYPGKPTDIITDIDLSFTKGDRGEGCIRRGRKVMHQWKQKRKGKVIGRSNHEPQKPGDFQKLHKARK